MIDEYHCILKAQNPQMTRDEARERYSNWYKDNFGISFDDLCPLCNSKLMLVRGRGSINSAYNHFIGCRNYPNCRFSANKKLKVLPETETVVIKNDEDASKMNTSKQEALCATEFAKNPSFSAQNLLHLDKTKKVC